MGDPRKTRRKYNPPEHPWNKERIDEERTFMREYSLGNKKEIYKMNSVLKSFKDQAKKLIALKTAQADAEKKQMLAKLHRIGLLQETTSLDPILDLGLREILERRLQTQVYKKGLAKTMKQARQFIVHGHIMMGGKKITSPSYIMSTDEEHTLNFSAGSKLNDIDHPERYVKQEEANEETKKAGKKKEKTKKEEVKKPKKEKASEESSSKEKEAKNAPEEETK
ncbi:30S ribosomal protein S4 [Candidatus Woesearchaeota archaeon]|nr:30S ribosomal protein S4 [Candidatus Woesearchaeota archaeon]